MKDFPKLFIPGPTHVSDDIFEVFSGPQQIGNYNVEWNGKDFNQKMVPSGIYLYRLKVNNESITKKMILTK